jgi:hypothetical protein
LEETHTSNRATPHTTNPKFFSGLRRPTKRRTTSAGDEAPHEVHRGEERCVYCDEISIYSQFEVRGKLGRGICHRESIKRGMWIWDAEDEEREHEGE